MPIQEVGMTTEGKFNSEVLHNIWEKKKKKKETNKTGSTLQHNYIYKTIFTEQVQYHLNFTHTHLGTETVSHLDKKFWTTI